MKLKNYLLINEHAIRVGMNLDRVFPDLAGKRVPQFSIIHQDKVTSIADIIKVYLTYAYYNLDGKFDLQQHEQESAQKMEETIFQCLPRLKHNEKNILSTPHRVKMPKLTDEEYKSLQAKVSKNLGINTININLLLQTKLQGRSQAVQECENVKSNNTLFL